MNRAYCFLVFVLVLAATSSLIASDASADSPRRRSSPNLSVLPKPDATQSALFVDTGLGTVDANNKEASALQLINLYNPTGPDGRLSSLVVESNTVDELGKGHVKVQQYWRGHRIEGGQATLHVDWQQGQAESLSGNLCTLEEVTDQAQLSRKKARRRAYSALKLQPRNHPRRVGIPELAYLVDDFGRAQLAWKLGIRYLRNGDQKYDILYVHARTGAILLRDRRYLPIKNRKVGELNHGTTLPGSTAIVEGGVTANVFAQAAYDNLGTIYDYYFQRHNRDSFGNAGEQILASINYGTHNNNAFWNGTQIVLGDGDGVTFRNFALSLDVIAHEFTHAVIERSVGLIYSGEGAMLHEGLANVFAAAINVYRNGGVTPQTWLIGDELAVNSSSDSVIYVLNNPTVLSGFEDFYPERTAISTGIDATTSHTNSTIASLAFQLLVEGGSHPRGKNSIVVPALGVAMAEKIFYRGLTAYLSPQGDFAALRNGTVQAALDLFGTGARDATDLAWQAVGVPLPDNPFSPAPPTLQNGVSVSVSNISTAERYFKVTVPSATALLTVLIDGPAEQDVDLYLRPVLLPTLTAFSCRPQLSGSKETCQIQNPAAGDWYVLLHSRFRFSNLQITATTVAASPNTAPTSAFDYSFNGLTTNFSDRSIDSDGSLATRSWDFGDGSSSTSANPTHTFATAGTRRVTLTVADDDGASAAVGRSITLSGQSPCAGCTSFGGQLAAGGFENEPNGIQYFSVAGTHVGVLAGPARTNFDLFLLKFDNGRWNIAAQSTSSGPSETIRFTGAAGTYLWQVKSVTGAGEYTLGISHP